MINENKLSINELMNYGINYGKSVPININELSKLFDSKEKRRDFKKNIGIIANDLIEKYKIPESIVRAYIGIGRIFSFEHNAWEKAFYLDYYSLMQCTLAYFMKKQEPSIIENGILSQPIEDVKIGVNQKLKEIRTELNHIENRKEFETFMSCHPNVYNKAIRELYYSNRISFENAKDYMSTKLTNVIINNKYLVDFMKNHIINNELFKGINKEKFLLYLAGSTLHKCSYFEDIDPAIYYAINYYLHKTEEETPDIKITVGSNTYTFLTFSKKLKEYLKTHPNVSMKKFKPDTFKDCSPEEVKEYLMEFQNEALENFEIVNTEDVYLPNGEDTGIKRNSTNSGTRRKSSTDEISLLTLKKRKFYSTNKEQIYVTLMGKNKFDGYLAHVLKNGYVIFEKHNKNTNVISNKFGAAYIMTIYNFNEFSKKTIPEIRDYVKQSPNGDISYLCHSGDWMSRLQHVVDKTTGISLPEIDRVLMKYTSNK